MTREEAALKLSFHMMQCGLLMPLGWIDKNGEGSELFEAFKMAQDALRAKDTNVLTNADRIRAMSNEELAVKLNGGCPPTRDEGDICYEQKTCTKCWLDWLKQPAEVTTWV